jgi:ribose transport system permease protein
VEGDCTLDAVIETKQGSLIRLFVKYPILPTLIFFVVMCVVFVFLSPTNMQGQVIFLSQGNLYSIFEATAGFSIGAFAMTLVLLVGCLDISSESIIAMCAVILGIFIETFHMGFWLSVFLTLSVGALCGFINSQIVIRFKVPSFLGTIAVSFMYLGLAYTFSGSKSILFTEQASRLSRVFGSIGSNASFLGLPVLLWWTVFFLTLFYLLISKSKFGRWAQAVGGNELSAFSSGVNVKMVRTAAFVLMGVVSAFIGVIFCARLGAASPNYGSQYTLKFIIAAVLGGTTFDGEGGNVFGTLLGSLVMGVLTNGLSIIGIDVYIQQVITGIVIVATVIFSVYISSKK